MDPTKVILCIYTLFDVEDTQQKRVRSIAEDLSGLSPADFKSTLAALKAKGQLVERGYNWRTDSYNYAVHPQHLIPLMMLFYTQEPDLTVKVLQAAQGMKPSSVQRMLWRFITSDFRNIDIETISDYDIGENIDSFLPAVMDARFAPLLMVFSGVNLRELLERTLTDALAAEEIIDTSHIRALVKTYRTNTAEAERAMYHVQCLTDLLDYLAVGSLPRHIDTLSPYHLVLSAIYNAYHGDVKGAMAFFKKAVTAANKSYSGYFTYSRSYLPLAIANFYMVLVGCLRNDDEGSKKALAVARSAGKERVAAAKVLYDILRGGASEKNIYKALNELYAGNNGIDRTLATLMCRFIGKEFSRPITPKWAVLRYEMSHFTPGLEQPVIEGAPYGQAPLLAGINRRQPWESVLSDLTGLNSQALDSPQAMMKEERIGYFMRNIKDNYATPRLQSLLKSGGWGAGKQLSMENFVSGRIEESADADRRIIEREVARGNSRYGSYSMGVHLSSILPEMTGESRLYVGHYAPYTLVEVTEEVPYITLHHDSSGFLITSNVNPSEVEADIIITHRGASSINFISMTGQQRPYYRRLLTIDRFPNEAEPQLRRFLKGIGGKIEVHSDLIEGGSTLPICDGNPSIIMQMRPDRNTRSGESYYNVAFFVRPLNGGRIKCTPGEGNEVIIDSSEVRTRVKRNLAKERENLEQLIENSELKIEDLVNSSHNSQFSAFNFQLDSLTLLPIIEYAQANPDRITCEWPEGARMRIKQRNSSVKWNGHIAKNDNGWFELEGTVEVDQDKVISMSQLLDLVNQAKGRYVPLGNGDYLALSEKLRRQLLSLSALISRHHGRLQMSPFTAALLDPDMTDGELTLTEDAELTQIRRRIKESSTYTPEVPSTLHATLREYQKEGYQWMSRLNHWGAGALLADDMGLGKTVQTIAFLLDKADEGPQLVVAPASVAPNWKVEFQKFAPSLRVTLLNFEQDRDEAIRRAEAGDVVVCTYMLLLSVKEEITKKQWTTICLDEAHIIKNRGAKTSAVAMKLKSRNRIMLTGTPVQNHLGELWNLFQFVNPGLLGTFDDFNRRFIQPIESQTVLAGAKGDAEYARQQLDRLVKPFMLRRTKDKVAQELPDKEEIYQHVTMSEEEQLAYEAMRQHAEALLSTLHSSTISVNTLAEITRLRLAACGQSKITAMLELLQTVLDDDTSPLGGESRGVLIFSQFTTYLAKIQQALDDASIPYLYIDGTVSIKERQQLVEKFQQGECPVFLISLKAGGLGLNLTHANYVIHMDPWWNPAIEAQATDRSHRIGQKRAVTVYHLISQGTIEEKIQRLHERKQSLVSDILSATDMSHRLTGEDLLEMVAASY